MQQLISKLKLKEQVDAQHQTYGLGIKEVWRVLPERHREGHVEHMIGYPLDSWTYGGGFLYHMSDHRVALGVVVGLDYWNTYLSPFHEYQKFKAHPHVRRILQGGSCLEYGARSLNEGVFQSRHMCSASIPRQWLVGSVCDGYRLDVLTSQLT